MFAHRHPRTAIGARKMDTSTALQLSAAIDGLKAQLSMQAGVYKRLEGKAKHDLQTAMGSNYAELLTLQELLESRAAPSATAVPPAPPAASASAARPAPPAPASSHASTTSSTCLPTKC